VSGINTRSVFYASVATMLAMLPAGSLPVEEREHERNKHAKPPRYPQSYCPSYHPTDPYRPTPAEEQATVDAAEAKRERKRAARLARKAGAP
jgi:hypothetical protein